MSHRLLIQLLSLSILLHTTESLAGLRGFTDMEPTSLQKTQTPQNDFPEQIANYRDLMRSNVIMLSRYAKSKNPAFLTLVHGEPELLRNSVQEYQLEDYNQSRKFGYSLKADTLLMTEKDLQDKPLNTLTKEYNQNIDALVLNNVFCGSDKREVKTKIPLISIDYCPAEKIDNAVKASVDQHILSYIFANRKYAFKDAKKQLIINKNAQNVENLQDAKNILFLLDASNFKDKEEYLKNLRSSNFDILVISPFFKGVPLTKEEVNELKYKKNGGLRKIIAAFNISETDSKKYYWQPDWEIGSPSWLKAPSSVDKQGIIVEYWSQEWQKILSEYFKGIVSLEFDGVFLTGLENYQYFENQTPLE